MRSRSLAQCGVVALLATASLSASAGNWLTQTVVANGGYDASIAIDASGRLAVAWYQGNLPNQPLNEVWARTGAVGQPWSVVTSLTGPVSGILAAPLVHSSASGSVTAVFNENDPAVGMFVDHPAGGKWGAPGPINGVNQFFVDNDLGDQGVAWGGGGPRGAANPIEVVVRPAGSAWSTATTIAAGAYVALDSAAMGPDGTMAVSWESYQAVCGSRTCKTTNWTLHVSTLPPGGHVWGDSGPLVVSASTQNHGQLVADGNGNIGMISLSAGNVVSRVRHSNGAWTSPVVVASISSLGIFESFLPGQLHDNRNFACDAAGHATVVGWGNIYNSNLAAADGNLETNTWGSPEVISGSDQYPGSFDLETSSAGQSIVVYPLSTTNSQGDTPTRAVVRAGAGMAWSAPATAGLSLDGVALPISATINSSGQAAVVFSGYTTDYTSVINYVNTYQP